jgi:hypothetical protein
MYSNICQTGGMTSARQIIEIVAGKTGRGAPHRVARLLGVQRATVYAWLRKNRIPSHRQQELLMTARRCGRPLRPEHFFDLGDPRQPPGARDGERGLAAPSP